MRQVSSVVPAYLDRACQILLLQVLVIVLLKHYFICMAAQNIARHKLITPVAVKDPLRCNALLNSGRWLDPSSTNTPFPYRNWQPKGCMMHKYTKDDLESCMGGRRIVIAGDSTGRQVFAAMVEKMGSTMDQVANTTTGLSIIPAHHDLMLHAGNISLQFLWEPYLNDSGIRNELGIFRGDTTDKGGKASAGLLFVKGPGLWYAKSEIAIEQYTRTINETFHQLTSNHNQELGQTPDFSNLLVMSSISIPWYPALNEYRRPLLTSGRIKPMNEYLSTLASNLNLTLSRSFIAMIEGDNSKNTHLEDGLHLVENVRDAEADVLLNLRCNSKHATRGYPHDRTCCMRYNKPGVSQFVVAFSGAILLIVTGLGWVRTYKTSQPPSRTADRIASVSTIILVLCFCYLADRTHVFEKAQKQFSALDFWLMCLAFALVGLAPIVTPRGPVNSEKSTVMLVLGRDQTNEWKGWMQVVILIYHYTGASSVADIYKAIRLLVAAYLFLTGYGHTLSMLRKPDYRLQKVMRILLRLNLLTLGLSYMMSTNYLFYYFPALASFWYVVVFTIMAVANRRNVSTWFLCSKILVAALLTTTFVLLPDIMESCGRVLYIVFRISWNIPEWRFRMQLDLFIVYIGMLIAILHQHYCNHGSQQRQHTLATTSITEQERWLEQGDSYKNKVILGLMTVLFIVYVLISLVSPDKFAYNHMNPYISWIPILAFVLLRNCHRTLLRHHLANLAWLGEISLETYVLQYHIWLAGDTKGLLRLGLFNRRVEAAIITVLFVWISWRTSLATKSVVAWVVDTATSESSLHKDSSNSYTLLSTNACEPLLESRVVHENSQQADNSIFEKKHNKLGTFSTPRLRSLIVSLGGSLKWRLFVIFILLWTTNLCTGS